MYKFQTNVYDNNENEFITFYVKKVNLITSLYSAKTLFQRRKDLQGIPSFWILTLYLKHCCPQAH